MKILIAGLGSIGRRHFRNLLTLGERDLLFYRTRRATLPEDELAGFPVEHDLQAALNHHPDAVIISNPTALHLDVAYPAAQAGCHLLMEKPISHSFKRVDQFEAIVAGSGSQVLVGFQFRFHPGLQQINRLLIEGVIGDSLSVRVHWGEYLPNWHPWEDYRQGYAAREDLGGGVILTLCHPLDYLRWLFGDVTKVWAFARQSGTLDLAVEDVAEIGMQFMRGIVGSVHLDYHQRPPTHRMEIVGTLGTIRWDNSDGEVHLSKAGPDGRPGEWQRIPVPENFERNVMFLDEMRNFLDMVRGESKPACTLHDGIEALRLALAARQSAQTGQLVLL